MLFSGVAVALLVVARRHAI